jgi:L-iditol 2-dehydrogenase
MKARQIVIPEPGRTEVREIDVPEPGPNEVQVRCVANGICMYEVSMFAGTEPLLPAGSSYGHEGVGQVIKIGRDVRDVAEGDWVICGPWVSVQNVPAAGLARFSKPPADPALAIAEPAWCVVIAAPHYEISPGDRVLLLGAGYMGLLNVQMLAHYPLAELVVTDVKRANLDLAREFGASEVIRSDTDEGHARLDALKQDRFDCVIEAAGVAETLQSAGELTRTGGRLCLFAWHHQPRTIYMTPWHLGGFKILSTAPGIGTDSNLNHAQRAIRLMERGMIDMTKLVTHRFPASDAQEAMEISTAREGGYIKGVFLFEG